MPLSLNSNKELDNAIYRPAVLDNRMCPANIDMKTNNKFEVNTAFLKTLFREMGLHNIQIYNIITPAKPMYP